MSSIKTCTHFAKNEKFRNLSVSRMEHIYDRRKGETDVPHRHGYYTVLLVNKATGEHIIDFKTYLLSGGQVFFIGPGQVHQVIEKSRSEGFSMVFSADFLILNGIPLRFIENINLFRDYGESPPLEPNESVMSELNYYLEQLHTLERSDDPFKQDAMSALLKLFLIKCNQVCTLPLNTQAQEAGNKLLQNFKHLVDENYSKWHKTSSYANHLNITSDYLNRTVKSLIGKTAKEYIQSRLTVAAERMLIFTNLTAKEISYELGFEEPAHFNSFFKKCTGIAPGAFRNRYIS
jgi:AraC family transcriptional activator of pobA